MENKTKLTVGVFITLALLIGSGATYFISQDDDAYFCESRDMVMLCEKLSSGIGTRCYYENTYKKCTEGWEKIEFDQEINTQVPGIQNQIDQSIPKPTLGIRFSCSPDGCVRIE